jgi:hypothetical protein
VKIRHGPATVSAESSSEIGHWEIREGSSTRGCASQETDQPPTAIESASKGEPIGDVSAPTQFELA